MAGLLLPKRAGIRFQVINNYSHISLLASHIAYLKSHISIKSVLVDIFFQLVEYAIFAVTKNLSLFLINKYNVKHEEH